ncbi:MAG: PhoX family phosphatase [Steroidobacteraceae bacterium]
MSRRQFIGAGSATVANLAVVGCTGVGARALPTGSQPSAFDAIKPGREDALRLARGYRYDVIARWGDAIFSDDTSLTGDEILAGKLTSDAAATRQLGCMGTNCDGIAYFGDAGSSARGVLCVNNEFVTAALTFAAIADSSAGRAAGREDWTRQNPQAVSFMQAAHGISIVEVARSSGRWKMLRGGRRNRRICATTPIAIAGPAAGAALLRTRADPQGRTVLGTFANCSAGRTPWGTYLSAEENIDDYFGGSTDWLAGEPDAAVRDAHRRFPLLQRSLYGWEYVDTRFDVRSNPTEPLRHGWIVEVDPQDPASRPVKRTALGRFSHESANSATSRDGRLVVYMGDDDEFEYIYKFVTRDVVNPVDRRANRDLLDNGTLYVARFDADGSGQWLPLRFDPKGPLGPGSGFASEADVVIRARAAADLLGATPMDRPEDIEPDARSGRVYIACTKNPDRSANPGEKQWSGRLIDTGVDAANPRANNRRGHIIELSENDGDMAALRFTWEVFVFAGGDGAGAAMACPDNLAIDPSGRLWVVTDTDDRTLANNGCFVIATRGAARGQLQQLASAPVGAELSGCEFTPDGRTLFLSVQHPGEGGTLDEPVSDWPDGEAAPPRSTVVAVTRDDSATI